MDADDILDLEDDGVLDHGYLPTPAPRQPNNNTGTTPPGLEDLSPAMRTLVANAIADRVRAAKASGQRQVQKAKQELDLQQQQFQ